VTGRRLGPYEVRERIGAGGMGEVYRARDTRLDRDVAIKILPPAFTQDPERRARFEREARLLAALNHPNIAAIHGVVDLPEDAGAHGALVMEFVDGGTLAERIAPGAIPVADAIAIARQIAAALDAAHDKGIVHRDLKPANIKISSDGDVKVLDFGLATAVSREDATADPTESPTVTAAGTRDGTILGTAAYMSPEQARGRRVDKRTDIWSFGCVLYEMLTGRMAFARDTISDTIVAILERDVDWSALPAATPRPVRRALERCLEKDPRRRLRDIGDLDLAGTDAAAPAPAAERRDRSSRYREIAAWSVALLAVLALGVMGWTANRGGRTGQPLPVLRTIVPLAPDERLVSGESEQPLAMSPDGARIAYVSDESDDRVLNIRDLNALEPRAVPGSRGARTPFFSPDGQWLAFFADGALQKVAVRGGAPQRICTVKGVSLGASWGPGDTIVFGVRGGPLSRVAATGGVPQPIPASGVAAWPQVLPDGHTVLFSTGENPTLGLLTSIAVMSLDGTGKRLIARTPDAAGDGPAVLSQGGGIAQAQLLPGGYLVYGQSRNPGAIQAIAFDPVSLTPKGPSVTVTDAVERGRNGGGVYFAVSSGGLLVYAATGERHQLVWADRTGAVTPVSPERGAFRMARLSPDGRQVAVAMNDDTRRSSIWFYDAARGTRRRLTNDLHSLTPAWRPDNHSVTFTSGGLLESSPDRTDADILLSRENAKALLPVGTSPYSSFWSHDGRELLFHADDQGIWALTRATRTIRPVLRDHNESGADFSPDDGWIAYVSRESGRDEVYVRRYPDLTGTVALSSEGGAYPRWSADGREIFFRRGDALMAVSIETSPALKADAPRMLFRGRFTGVGGDGSFDVSPDGRRFLLVKSDEAAALNRLTLVQNWIDTLAPRR